MPMVTEAKDSRFIFAITADERRMLDELAEAEGRSAAGWLRQVIRAAHAEKFGPAPKPRRSKK